MCVCPRLCIHSLCRDSKLQLLFTPSPNASAGRKPAQRAYACVRAVRVCVCVRACEDERSCSYYIKQDFPEQSAAATEFPKPSSGFPLQQKVDGLSESRLFVLERHCSGAAEAMSQHHCHSLCPPATHCSIIKWLLLHHLASFPWWYLYSHTPVNGFYFAFWPFYCRCSYSGPPCSMSFPKSDCVQDAKWATIIKTNTT